MLGRLQDAGNTTTLAAPSAASGSQPATFAVRRTALPGKMPST
jgi:hypothetical protein